MLGKHITVATIPSTCRITIALLIAITLITLRLTPTIMVPARRKATIEAALGGQRSASNSIAINLDLVPWIAVSPNAGRRRTDRKVIDQLNGVVMAFRVPLLTRRITIVETPHTMSELYTNITSMPVTYRSRGRSAQVYTRRSRIRRKLMSIASRRLGTYVVSMPEEVAMDFLAPLLT